MLDTGVRLERRDKPFTYFTAGGLISPEDLRRLNSAKPDRGLFSREIKVGEQHRKQYHMWRLGIFEDGARTPSTAELPPAWSELLDSALSDGFRTWLSGQSGTDIRTLPMTAGFYVFGDRDYTTVDTGKAGKALSMAIYLTEGWRAEYGGGFQAWAAKEAPAPEETVVPYGGHCVARTYSAHSWHNIATVDTGGTLERMTLQLEFWRTR